MITIILYTILIFIILFSILGLINIIYVLYNNSSRISGLELFTWAVFILICFVLITGLLIPLL